MLDLRELTSRFPRPGRLDRILLRPMRRAAMIDVAQTEAIVGRGLAGDRAFSARPGGRRQVTLLQAEHVPVIAAVLGLRSLKAETLRRNLAVSGINLLAAKALFADRPIHVHVGSDVVLEVTGPCEPCSRMEEALGQGGYNAVRGHGGVTARVLRGGVVRIGDAIVCEAA